MKEGVFTYEALGLHKYAPVQSSLAALIRLSTEATLQITFSSCAAPDLSATNELDLHQMFE